MFRRIIFWIHLCFGLATGIVIAVMSATGIAIAFEQEILDWVDREAAASSYKEGQSPYQLAELREILKAERPAFHPTAVHLSRDPGKAYRFMAGRSESLYVNPYSGRISEPQSGKAHDILHTLEDWHRWLGAGDHNRGAGRLVTGISNLAFLGLCLTGLYLWFPRRWSRAVLRRSLWFVRTRRSKARDFNWHNVFGFWSLPVLLIVIGTGVVISFDWAHRLVFYLSGEEPPKYRDFRMMMVRPPELPKHNAPTLLLEPDQVLARVKAGHPDWEAILFNFPGEQAAPLDVTVFEPAPFATAGRVMLHLDPVSGEELQSVSFSDRSRGIRARVWIRFLHTGEAFGLNGKILASLASAAALVLVYTGFALAWRRLVPGSKAVGRDRATTPPEAAHRD